MVGFTEATLSLDALLLDPNNYRFQDDPEFVTAAESRFHEETVQDSAYQRLHDNGLVQLKKSIVKNGYLPVERVIVRPYASDTTKYVVIEGNRRVAALRWIRRDHEAGVDIPNEVLATLGGVPAIVVPSSDDDPAFAEALMGVRHVSGIKQWGGYQRAKLVAVLRDDRGLESGEIADRLGMTVQEVNRRYKAFRALQQMQGHETFAEASRPEMYPIFHEALGHDLPPKTSPIIITVLPGLAA